MPHGRNCSIDEDDSETGAFAGEQEPRRETPISRTRRSISAARPTGRDESSSMATRAKGFPQRNGMAVV